MALRLQRRSVEGLPISVHEFYQSFIRAGVPPRPNFNSQRSEGYPILGLAISGGVDSMALALLCSELPASINHLTRLRFQAFVVDHGARAGSSVEAKSVSRILRDRGINTKILQIQWPIMPSEISNFESVARTYRFQALGKACRDSDIQSLLLAHHEDDQAETLLMRLAAGHRGPGLVGMKSKSDIPECWGIYGVHQSSRRGSGTMTLNRPGKGEALSDEHDSIVREPMLFQCGGIRVYRPLLSFSKERLVATCIKAGMPWFEDSTNADPTLTPRNAVRHIMKTHTLPVALRKPSLINLCENLRVTQQFLLRRAYDILHHSHKTFDTRSGTLIIRFPDSLAGMQCIISSRGENEILSLASRRRLAKLALQLAIECVSPQKHVSIKSESYAERVVFPSLYEQNKRQEEETHFSIASVKFTRMDPTLAVELQLKPTTEPGPNQTAQDPSDLTRFTSHTWLISRQPYPSRSQKPLLVFPPSYPQHPSEWALYDGRYWIRVINHTSYPLHVRPLCTTDMQQLRQRLQKEHPAIWTRLTNVLKDAAPGSRRYTLPVIVKVTTAMGPDERDASTTTAATTTEKVVALPTLNTVVLPPDEERFAFQIRYKKIPYPVRHQYTASVGQGP